MSVQQSGSAGDESQTQQAASSSSDSNTQALLDKIDSLSREQLKNAQDEISNDKSSKGWSPLAQDGKLRLYSRELEIDGIVCDPLKAVHLVQGLTGFEICHRFFDPETHKVWDSTLEAIKVLKTYDDETVILHQIHKRIWPAAQRDAVFFTHIRRVEQAEASRLCSEDFCPKNNPNLELLDVWIVTNNSTDIIDVPLNGCVRVKLTVSMVCETYVNANADKNNIKREDLTCKIIYIASINPGGWAPSAILRQVYKREYFNFLKTFTQYVKNNTKPDCVEFNFAKKQNKD